MRKLSIVVVTLLLLTTMIGIASAAPPPVPQNIGLQDISIINLSTSTTDQSACRVCHLSTGTNLSGIRNGSTYSNTTVGGVPTRHHTLVPRTVINPMTNAPFGCSDCHPSNPGIGNGIVLDRSCLDCHAGLNYSYNSIGGHVGNITRPHHVNTAYASSGIGNPAQTRTCNFCHGSVVDNYNDGHYSTFLDPVTGAGYASSEMITPFASFKAVSTVPDGLFPQGGEMNFSTGLVDPSPTGGNKTWGGCYSCHLSNYSATPKIGSNHNNHHNEINGLSASRGGKESQGVKTPGEACSWCHVIKLGTTGPLEIDITTMFGANLVGAMEVRNSTIEAVSIFEPGTTNITVNGTGCEKCHDVKSLHNIQFNYVPGSLGQQGLGHINNNTDCNGCHADWVASDVYVPGALVPTVNTVTPSVISANTPTTVTIAGVNFVNDPYTSVVTIDGGQPITPSSITDAQIVVDIPALSVGTHQLQLVKGGDTLSGLQTLVVVPAVTLSSAVLDGTTLTITGTGYGAIPATNPEQHIVVGSVGYATSITSWSDTQIVTTVTGTVVAGDAATVITADAGEAQALVTIATPTPTPTPTVSPTPTPTPTPVPTITSAKLKSGVLTIVGTNFETKPTSNPQTYVTTVRSGRTYTANSITSWITTKIVAKVGTNFRVGQTVTVKTVSGKTAQATIAQG